MGCTVPFDAALIAFAAVLVFASVPAEGMVELVSAGSGAAATAVDDDAPAVPSGVAAVAGEASAGEAVESAVVACGVAAGVAVADWPLLEAAAVAVGAVAGALIC